VIRRKAAALLCGAAAVHLADLAFYAGQALGVSGVDGGRAWALLLLLLPAAWLARVAWDSTTGAAVFLLGACAGYGLDEWLLLPALGFGWTTLIWVGGWALARFAGRRMPATLVSTGRAGAIVAGASLLGAGLGFGLAFLRPFLFQHVAGSRHGLRIAAATALVGLLVGAALGQALKRRFPRPVMAFLGVFLALLGCVTSFLLLPRASGGLTLPLATGAWTLTWWGRSILASWSMLGLLMLGVGLVTPLLTRRRAVACLVAGLCAGTWAGESSVRALGKDPAHAREIAEQVARHPPTVRIEAAALGPEGIWSLYRTRSLLDIEPIGFWQATRLDRGELWKNLEAAEVESSNRPALKADARVFDRSDAMAALQGGGDATWPSLGYLASGFTLRETVGNLREAASRFTYAELSLGEFELTSFRDWCDPRALTPAGVRSLLATWREAFPDATFLVLVDGYGGPLLGLRMGRDPSSFPIARQLTVFEKKVSEAFRGELGPVSTTLRPVLEWETAPEPSPFIHPRDDVMRALVGALAIEPGSPVDHLFRGLVIHADAQVVRPYVVSAWDHVALPEDEVREYMAALAKDDRSPQLIRHLQIVFDVLLKKREYAMLVRHLEEAVARRPDVFAFHRTLGKAYADILDYGNAVEELSHARTLDPHHHEVAIELSRALGGAQRWTEAVALLDALLAEHDEPDVRKGLAIALTEAGQLDRARALIRELAASYPADVDIMKAQDRLKGAESR
jgi:tetratricopeptide (TPR) repeat protein